jgi:hypothetical protein
VNHLKILRSKAFWRALREAPLVEGRSIRLRVFDGRDASERKRVNLVAAVQGAIALFEEGGGHAEELIASELDSVGAWPGFPAWYGALCGMRRCYVAPFDTVTFTLPLFVAIELYGAAGVHRAARKFDVKSTKDVATLQHFAWKYQEQLIQSNELPDDWIRAFRELRSVVPDASSQTAAG